MLFFIFPICCKLVTTVTQIGNMLADWERPNLQNKMFPILVGNVANMLPTFCQMSVVLPNFAATYDFWNMSTRMSPSHMAILALV